MNYEHKKFSFKLDSYNEEEGIFTGYGAVFSNIDSGGDIIEPGAFTETLAEGWERVKILALHNDCWLPIGRPVELREDANGLFLSARISDTSMGRDVKVLLKDGVLNELSIGYDPVVFDYDNDGIRHLRKIRLWEISVVTWAMNPAARISGYKSLQDAAAVIEGALRRERTGEKEISAARLKSLKEASGAMKNAARAIDTVLRDGAGKREKRRTVKEKNIIITF